MRKIFDKLDDFVRYLAGVNPIINGVLFLFIGVLIVFNPILGIPLLVTILIIAFFRMKRYEREENVEEVEKEGDDDKDWKEEWKVDWNEEWKDP